MKIYHRDILRFENGKFKKVKENIVIEDTYHIYFNNFHLADIIASSENLEELGIGFIICEGISEKVEKVEVLGNSIKIYGKGEVKSMVELRTSGCIGTNPEVLKKLNSDLKISCEEVSYYISFLQTEIWEKTGGVHCASLFMNKKLIVRISDVGRHNTIDKVVGFAYKKGLNLSKCILASTGRQTMGMIYKILNGGIPIVISQTSPTDKGIKMAEKGGITLIGFARNKRFNVYTHHERIGV